MTGVLLYKWEDQEFKKQQMPDEWGMTYREFLQKLGTDAMRDGLHQQAWVNALFADYTVPVKDDNGNVYPKTAIIPGSKWIITDTRFPNEADAIKERGGLVVRIERPSTDDNAGNHPSETALDDYSFDYRILNNGTIDGLVLRVKEFLTKFDIT